MHPSSINNMKLVKTNYLSHLANITILDVGGRGLTEDNRSYYPIFKDVCQSYFVADIVDGPGVTHIMNGPYSLPFDDNTIDLVVSGQMLEHSSNPFKSVAEMNRVLRSGGYMVLIAPSSGPRHDTQDGWRFMDDAFKFIAEDVGNIDIVADWIDRKAPDERSRKWQDHIFVGKKL